MNRDNLKKIIILFTLIIIIFSCSSIKNELKNIKPFELIENDFGKVVISGDTLSNDGNQNYRKKIIILNYVDLSKGKLKNNIKSRFLITNDENDVIYYLKSEVKKNGKKGIINWKGRTDIDVNSIGIEIENNSNSNVKSILYEDFQIKNTVILIKYLIEKYGILPQNVLGYMDVAPKINLGFEPLFPWEDIYIKYGIGMWYDADIKEKYINEYINIFDNISVSEIQMELKKFGYEIEITNVFDRQTKNIVKAFQFHFRNEKYDGIMDLESFSILKALNEKYNNIER